MVSEASFLQLLQIETPIEVIDEESVSDVKELSPEKALSPIEVTEFGVANEVSCV